MTDIFTVACLLLFTSFVFTQDDVVDYYEKLIEEEEKKMKDYVMPSNAYAYRPNSSGVIELDEVDFIIVGTGTAGSILANRLSEISQWKVVALEAGKFEDEISAIPAMSMYKFNSEYNWGYKTIPQKCAEFGFPNRVMSVPAGKGVGGSTLINGLRYVRANRKDFDTWNVKGWSYKEVLNYFKKVENSSIYNADIGYHGFSGPMHVEYYNGFLPHLEMVADAYRELGYPVLDYNGKSQIGMSRSQVMSKQGVRQSTGRVYVKPVLNRLNLKVYTEAFVTKILLSPTEKKAEGIMFSRLGQMYSIRARKEVILSAGTIGTPKLLMLSGVGPLGHLQKLGIPLIKELPVGEILRDHPHFNGLYFNTRIREVKKTSREYIQEWLLGTGPYSIATGLHGLSFIKTKYAKKNSGADINISIYPPNPIFTKSSASAPYYRNISEAYYKHVDQNSAILMHPVNVQPQSTGSIRLKSNNSFDHPLIDLNYLCDNRDIEVLYESFQHLLRLSKTEAYKKLNATLAPILLPQCSKFEYLSKNYWICILQHMVAGGYHLMSTCKMANTEKQGGVVDNNLKVFGVKRLRVIDGSVIKMTSGYPVAIVMMIAEKGADLIKNEYLTNNSK